MTAIIECRPPVADKPAETSVEPIVRYGTSIWQLSRKPRADTPKLLQAPR